MARDNSIDPSKIETQLEEYIGSTCAHSPGVAVAVVEHDQIIAARGLGVTSAEPESALPVTDNTLFCVGSITKPITGTVVMRLVEQDAHDGAAAGREELWPA